MKLTVDLYSGDEREAARKVLDAIDRYFDEFQPELQQEVDVNVEHIPEEVELPVPAPVEEPEVIEPPAEEPAPPAKAKVPGQKAAPVAETPALNDVKTAVRELVRNGKMSREDVEALLATYNVKAVSEMDENNRADFYEKCKIKAGEVEDVPF